MIIENKGLRHAFLAILMLVLSPIAAADDDEFYLSLGTSLSVGIQPILFGADIGENQRTNDGYPDQLFDILTVESEDLACLSRKPKSEESIVIIHANDGCIRISCIAQC